MSVGTLHLRPAAADDRYPSRVDDRPRVIPRVEPVVYGASSDGPLNEAEIEAYERDGFLVLHQLLDVREVAHLNAELDRLAAEPGIRAREETVREHAQSAWRATAWSSDCWSGKCR